MSFTPSIESWGCLLREQAKKKGYTITYSRPQLVNGGLSPPPAKHYPGVVCYMAVITLNNTDFYGFGPSPSLATHYAEFETFNSLTPLPSELVNEVCSSMSFKDDHVDSYPNSWELSSSISVDGEDGKQSLDSELDHLCVSNSQDHEYSVDCTNVNESLLSTNLYHESGPNSSSERSNDIDIAKKTDDTLPPHSFVQEVSLSKMNVTPNNNRGSHPLSYFPTSPPNSSQLKVPSSFEEYCTAIEKPPPPPRPFDPSVWDHTLLPRNSSDVVRKLFEVANRKGMYVSFDYKTFGPKCSKIVSVKAKAGGFVFQGSGVKWHIAKYEAASKLLMTLQQLPYPSLNEVSAVKPRVDPFLPHSTSTLPTCNMSAPPTHSIPAMPTHHLPTHSVYGCQHGSYDQQFQKGIIRPTRHLHPISLPSSTYQPFPYGPPPTYQRTTLSQPQMLFSSYSHMERMKDVRTEKSDSDSDCEKISSGLHELIPRDLFRQKSHDLGFNHDRHYVESLPLSPKAHTGMNSASQMYSPNDSFRVEHPVQSECHSKESRDVMTQVLAVEHMALSDPLHFVTRLPQARKKPWSSSEKEDVPPSHPTLSDKPSWRRIRDNYVHSGETTYVPSKTLYPRVFDSNVPHSPLANKIECRNKDNSVLRVVTLDNPSIPLVEPKEAADQSPLVTSNNSCLLLKCGEDKESSFESNLSMVNETPGRNLSSSPSGKVTCMHAKVESDISCHDEIENDCVILCSPTVDFKGEVFNSSGALDHSSKNSISVDAIKKDGNSKAVNEICQQSNVENESTEEPALPQVLVTTSDRCIQHTGDQLATANHTTQVQTSTFNKVIKQAETGIVSVKIPPPCRQELIKSEAKRVGSKRSDARNKPEEVSIEYAPEDKAVFVLPQSLTMDSEEVTMSTTSLRQLPVHPILAFSSWCKNFQKPVKGHHIKQLESDVSSFCFDDSTAIVHSSSSAQEPSGAESAQRLECLSDREKDKCGSNFLGYGIPSVSCDGVDDLGHPDKDFDCASQSSADLGNVTSQEFKLTASTRSIDWHSLENCSVSLPSEGSLKSLEPIFDSN